MGFPSTPYLLTSSLWAYLSPFLLSYCPWAYYFYLWTPLGTLASFEAYFLFSRLMIYYSCRSGLMVFFLPIYLLFSTHIVQLLLAIGLFCRNENQHFINTIIKVYLDTAYCWKHCNKIIFKWVNSAVGPNFKVDFARFRTCWSCEQCETYRNETQMCNAGKKRYPNSHLMWQIFTSFYLGLLLTSFFFHLSIITQHVSICKKVYNPSIFIILRFHNFACQYSNIIEFKFFYQLKSCHIRAFALAHAKILVYFNIRTYFFYLTYSLFKTPNISYLFYILFH